LPEFPVRQRLAAILAADVAGYSRLMAGDERATVAALDSARGVFREHIDAQQGRVIDMAGDSVLAVFDTATGAVAAALAVQEGLAAMAEDVSEDRKMRFRIGVHLGDIMEKTDGTVYGDGVNIAARLEGLAEPGGITVSDAVQGAVRGKVTAGFIDQGEQQVKNIPHPVRAFRVDRENSGAGTPAAQLEPALPAKPAIAALPSIAVLPFANMSGDAEQEYFADGIVEDIITALSRMQSFFVIARNSSFTYKGKAVDIKQVGRELGVRYVLEGSVRKAGNRVRITGQLIEAENGSHVWADRFDGALDDIFDLQDRITESVVGAIEPSIRRAEIDRVRLKPTNNLDAYDLCLRAMQHLRPGASGPALDEALGFLRRAIELDPAFSIAKALAAFACVQRVLQGFGDADDVKSGLRYAEQALANHQENPTTLSISGLALGTLGYRALGIRVLGFRYDEALHAIEHALSLGPNLFIVLFAAGTVRMLIGEADAAIEHFTRAMRVSPRDPGMGALISGIGSAHHVAGRYEEALAAGQRATHESPDYVGGYGVMVRSLVSLGRLDEAKTLVPRLLELAPGLSISRFRSVNPYKDKAYRNRMAEGMRAAGIPE
jgi:adenylate cyclase